MNESKQQMSEASKAQLINWINAIIKTKCIQVSNFQQLATGVAFCEVLNIIYPHKVDLSKVYIKPKDEYEIQKNFKHLSTIFQKLNLRPLEVPKLIKGRQQDILSVGQYLKRLNDQKEQEAKMFQTLRSQQSPSKHLRFNSMQIGKGSARNTARQIIKDPTNFDTAREKSKSKNKAPILKTMPTQMKTIKKQPDDRLTKLEEVRVSLIKKLNKIITITQSSEITDLQQFKSTLLDILDS